MGDSTAFWKNRKENMKARIMRIESKIEKRKILNLRVRKPSKYSSYQNKVIAKVAETEYDN